MSDILERLNETTTITKRELLLTAIAGLMTGIVVGMKSERRHRPPMPPCPPPHHCKKA